MALKYNEIPEDPAKLMPPNDPYYDPATWPDGKPPPEPAPKPNEPVKPT